MTMILELKNIKKFFPVKKDFLGRAKGVVRAIDDVSLTLPKGENLSLVGESGCGKTTLARVIMKLYPVDSGRIIFEGEDMAQLKGKKLKKARKNLQMVFQDPYNSLDPRYSIRSILKEAFGLDRRQYPTKAQKEQRMQELLQAVHLPLDMLNRYPHELSGGERQRVAIARALVFHPRLLILDEAVSSLDVLIQEEIISLLKELQEKFQLTYLFISHNLKVVRKISHTIAVMYQGRIVEIAKTKDLFENPLHPYTQELLSAALRYKAVKNPQEILMPSDARLVDKGGGHWVMEKR